MSGGNNFPFAFKLNAPNNEAAKTRRSNLLAKYKLTEERNRIAKNYNRLHKEYTNTLAMRVNPNRDLRPTLEDVRQIMRLRNEAKRALDWFNMTNPGINGGALNKKRHSTIKNRKKRLY